MKKDMKDLDDDVAAKVRAIHRTMLLEALAGVTDAEARLTMARRHQEDAALLASEFGMTFEDIGEALQVSRQRVGQMVAAAKDRRLTR